LIPFDIHRIRSGEFSTYTTESRGDLNLNPMPKDCVSAGIASQRSQGTGTGLDPLSSLFLRKSLARSLRGKEGYLVRRRIYEEERVAKRVLGEPVTVSTVVDRGERSAKGERSTKGVDGSGTNEIEWEGREVISDKRGKARSRSRSRSSSSKSRTRQSTQSKTMADTLTPFNIKSMSIPRNDVQTEVEVEQNKLLSVCWEGRSRTRLIGSWR